MPIGVLTNCAAVLLGGLLGTYLGKILPRGLKDNLPTLFGFCSIAIGVNSIIKASGMTAVVLAILVGLRLAIFCILNSGQVNFFITLFGYSILVGRTLIWNFTSQRSRCSAVPALDGTAL